MTMVQMCGEDIVKSQPGGASGRVLAVETALAAVAAFNNGVRNTSFFVPLPTPDR